MRFFTIEKKGGTCRPVEVLKTETVLPVQTRRRLASFENAGGEETKFFPPVNIFMFSEETSLSLASEGMRV